MPVISVVDIAIVLIVIVFAYIGFAPWLDQ